MLTVSVYTVAVSAHVNLRAMKNDNGRPSEMGCISSMTISHFGRPHVGSSVTDVATGVVSAPERTDTCVAAQAMKSSASNPDSAFACIPTACEKSQRSSPCSKRYL